MHRPNGDKAEMPTDVGVSVLARVAWVILGSLIAAALVAASFWFAGNV